MSTSNTPDQLGKQLIDAAKDGNVIEIEDLHKHGAPINFKIEGMTALMYSALNNNTEVVNKLIELGTDINLKNIHGYTALEVAIIGASPDVVKILIPKYTDYAKNIDNIDSNGKTLLVLAVETAGMYRYPGKGVIEMVDTLLDLGANITAKDREGKTLLQYAIDRKDLDLIKFLLDKGADILGLGYERKNVVQYAETYFPEDREEIINYLKPIYDKAFDEAWEKQNPSSKVGGGSRRKLRKTRIRRNNRRRSIRRRY